MYSTMNLIQERERRLFGPGNFVILTHCPVLIFIIENNGHCSAMGTLTGSLLYNKDQCSMCCATCLPSLKIKPIYNLCYDALLLAYTWWEYLRLLLRLINLVYLPWPPTPAKVLITNECEHLAGHICFGICSDQVLWPYQFWLYQKHSISCS